MIKLQNFISFHLINGVFVASGIAALFGILLFTNDILSRPQNDLVTRIVGTRIFLKGEDPYTFHSNSFTEKGLIDPSDWSEYPVSRLTVTPTNLVLHIPFISIDHESQRIIWFFLQWMLFISTTLILFSLTKNSDQRKLICIGIFLFSITPIWRWHLENGQIYIVYAFLLALAYKFYVSSLKNSEIVSGIMLGFLSALRPTFGVVWLSMLFFNKKKIWIGGFLGFVFGIVFPLLLKIDIWNNYLQAMNVYSESQTLIYESEQRNSTDISLGSNSSLQGIIVYFSRINIPGVIFFIVMVIILIVFIFYLKQKKNVNNTRVFFSFICLAMLFEILIPAPRLIYSDIVFIVPLSILIINSSVKEFVKSKYQIVFLISLYFALKGFSISTYLFIFYFICHTGVFFDKFRKLKFNIEEITRV